MRPVDVPSVLALLVLAGLALLGAAVAAVRRRRSADSFARRVGLELDPLLAPTVTARLRRTVVASLLGAAAGLGVGALLEATVRQSGEPVLLIGLAAAVTGGSLGAGLRAAAAATARVPDGPRIARSTEVRLDDYIAPYELLPARVLGVAGALVPIVLAVVGTGRGPTAAAWVFAALSLVSVVLLEVAGGRIVRRPQPAASGGGLAWDDALRSFDVRSLATAPMVAGVWAIELGASPLLEDATRRLSPTGTGLVGLGVVLIVVLAVVLIGLVVAAKPQQHYLRRLWPAVAARGAA